MKGCMETQAILCGEGSYRLITGMVRISPLANGSVVQAHVRGLPCQPGFFGLYIELCGKRCPLPPLMGCEGEALMSVYTCAFCPEDTAGGCVVLTTDPCMTSSCSRIASGSITRCARQIGCTPDPRPLFAAPIYR